jgi:curli biogenesis system outer membrane secretion channel CsgG|tara:strand:- start:323 stop:1285 length:963 start_codon:yes stop_codon:yes gene_type:complete
MKRFTAILLISFYCFSTFSCTTITPPVVIPVETNKQTVSKSIEKSRKPFIKRKVAIGRFTNETNYGKGFFDKSNENTIGRQAMDILSTRLTQSEKFIMLEREDMDLINSELKMNNLNNLNIAADYLIIGSISEFGRNTTGEVGVFSRTKKQSAYAKVNIRLVDVSTGQLIYSEEGAGEAFSEVGTVLGAGTRAGYDSSLNDKVISAAISKLVNNIIENLTEKPWRSYILSFKDGVIVIAGGKTQGIMIGDNFNIFKKGQIVTNPQTGMKIELPGELISKVIVTQIMGNNINDEISTAEVLNGEIDISNLKNYYIEEITNN